MDLVEGFATIQWSTCILMKSNGMWVCILGAFTMQKESIAPIDCKYANDKNYLLKKFSQQMSYPQYRFYFLRPLSFCLFP